MPQTLTTLVVAWFPNISYRIFRSLELALTQIGM